MEQIVNQIRKSCALHHHDRIPVVSKDNKPLMPCKPSKVKKLLNSGKAKSRWSKLGIFYIQLTIEIMSKYNTNQYFTLANDPGSKFDGFALACKYVQLRLMAIMPEEIADKRKSRNKGTGKMGNRVNLRRARRYRNTRRRPWRGRSPGPKWIAPSQLAKVLFRLAIVKELCKLFPVDHFIVEDVKFNHYSKRYGKYFSTVEIGKTRYYNELRTLGDLALIEGWQTKSWREDAGLKKTSKKDAEIPESHANDAVAMLTGLADIKPDNKSPFWVYRRPEFVRRSLHRQKFQKGGIRPLFGRTCNGSKLRKGDYVETELNSAIKNKDGKPAKNEKGKIKRKTKIIRGWVCGLPTLKTLKVGIMDSQCERIGQFTPSKVHLLKRSGNILWKKII